MADFLRATHPINTAYWVASKTGISPGTIVNWLLHRSGPDRNHLSILMCVYGPAFLQAVLSHPPEWVSRAYTEIVEAELRRSILDAETKLAAIQAGNQGR